MHLRFRNVNDAFRSLVQRIHSGEIPTVKTTSRAGDVLQIPEPVTITYTHPQERVLFNRARDANPFFHLMESLWMLAGRNDVAPMAYYNSNIAEIASDDGKTFNGAYGYRWRHATIPSNTYVKDKFRAGEYTDQLPIIIDQLKRKPDSRRVVLQMWNVEDDLLKIDNTKDVCCNTCAYFLIRTDLGYDPSGTTEYNRKYLDMTVCNRSNDLVWGMLGANVVHFSVLQEYLAAAIGVEVGYYHQFTNNMHVYTSRWEPEKYLADETPDWYTSTRPAKTFPLINDPKQFETELHAFNLEFLGRDTLTVQPSVGVHYHEPFLQQVALPMHCAIMLHKLRDYVRALKYCGEIAADDWRIAATDWITKRRAGYERARDDGPSHTQEKESAI